MNNPKFIPHAISFIFIWFMIIPAIPTHLFAFIYQAVCFRLYGIERVQLRSYVSFDRQKLSYLSTFDKINCGYCSYMNGLFMWITEIAHRTEFYWCGIKHKNQPNNPAFAYQEKFADYGDKEAYDKMSRQ